MRTNIEIDDKLMRKAMRLGRFKTKREAVQAGLEAFVRLNDQQAALKRLWGAHHLIEDTRELDKAHSARQGW